MNFQLSAYSNRLLKSASEVFYSARKSLSTSYIESLYRNIRVKDWRAYFSLGVLGFFSGTTSTHVENLVVNFLKLTVTLSLYLAFAFSINNCFDVEADALRAKKLLKNPVAAGLISFKAGLVFSVCLALLGAFITVAWFHSSPFTVSLYLSKLLLAGFYSVPPLRLKSRPFFDLLSHGFFFGALPYLYGVSISGDLTAQFLYVASSIFTYSLILELRNHVEDYAEDLFSGVETTAVHLGYTRSQNLLKTLLALHWLYLTLLMSTLSLYAVTLPLSPLFYLIARWKSVNVSSRYIRAADLLTCVAYALTAFSSGVRLEGSTL